MRVVSVLPSATEMVFALGHGAELVGRSAECDYPVEARILPVVMRPRTLDDDHPSGEIDTRVREARSRGESLYFLEIERLKSLRPDLLLTQDLCGVCSVTSEEVTQACTRAGVAPRVLSLTPRTLEEVWESIPAVAVALGDPNAGARLLRATHRRAESHGPPAQSRPRIAVVEWIDPPILAGLWSSEMIRAAGGRTVGPGPGEPAEKVTWPELARRSPELVVLTPCSFSVERTQRELADPRIARAISGLSPRLGIHVADEAYFSRPGPRLADGVELLRGLIAGTVGPRPMPVERWDPAFVGAVKS
jgi:iron complex transport system substrate-binding protein